MKISVVTGSRAEYGLLWYVLDGIRKSKTLDLQLIVTGMHLSLDFGLTYKNIEEDGFSIKEKVHFKLPADNPIDLTTSIGSAMDEFGGVFDRLKPDMVLLLGDRYELLPAGFSAFFAKIPIVHIHGGEITLGAFDDSIRHCLTKISWLHFVASEEYRNRVIQLGEDPKRVFNVGGLGVDVIKRIKFLSKRKLMQRLGIQFRNKNLLVTFHPITLEQRTSENNLKQLLNALNKCRDIYIIFTMPNADPDGLVIKDMIEDFVKENKNRSIAFTSMGHINYLSTMKLVDGVLGNSSSGLLEAPSFRIGTINIGDRQGGRLKANSVIDCNNSEKSILNAINKLYSKDFQSNLKSVKNPYGEGNAADTIIDILEKTVIPTELKKGFYDL